MKQALGFIEIIGLASAIEATDCAMKTADVKLIGLEKSKGSGKITVKIEGSVSAVQTAVDAADAYVKSLGETSASIIIARPDDSIECFLENEFGTHGAGDVPAKDPEQEFSEKDESVGAEYTCNLCGDPNCTRTKGEPHKECIHYGDKKLNENNGR